MLDFALNGRVAQRLGNRQPDMAPRGIFPCAGEGRWIAIACRDDADWTALKQALGDPAWAAEPRYASVAGRIAGVDTIEACLSDWTAGQDAFALMERLQDAGVPAGVVSSSAGIMADPQLAHRGQFWR